MGIDNVDFIKARAEEAGRNPLYREKFSFAVSRGLASLPVLLEFCAPLVKKEGQIVTWKGDKVQDEISSLGAGYSLLGLSEPHIVDFTRPDKDWTARLVSFVKEDLISKKYPRSFQAIRRKHIGFMVNNLEGKNIQ